MALLNAVGAETGDFSQCHAASGSILTVSSAWAHSGTYSFRFNDPAPAGNNAVLTLRGYGADAKSAVLGESELWLTFYINLATLTGDTSPREIGRVGADAGLVCRYTLNHSTGELFFQGSGSAVAVATLTTGVYRIDVHALQNGTCDIYVDGASHTTVTGGNHPCDQVNFFLSTGFAGSFDYYIDDIVIDDAGFPSGIPHVLIAVPTGNSATFTDWTVGSGQKWEAIDEIPPTNTAEITSGTSSGGKAYAATHANAATLGIDGDILGVIVVARMSEVSSTSTLGRIGLWDGSSLIQTTDVDIGNTSDITLGMVVTDQGGFDLPWDETSFNASEAAVIRSSSDTSNIACSALYLMVAWVEETLVLVDLAGAPGAPSGEMAAKQFDLVEGAPGAPSGTVARLLDLNRSVAGAPGAPSGALAFLRRYFETLAGEPGAPSGTVARQLLLNRSVAGLQGAPSGVVDADMGVVVSGTQDAPSGVIQTLQYALAEGAPGEPSGTLALVYRIAIEGEPGAPSGEVAAGLFEQLAGLQPASLGDIVAVFANKLVTGAPGAPSGDLAALQLLARMIDGEQAAPAGTVDGVAARFYDVGGLQGEAAGELVVTWVEVNVAGVQPPHSGAVVALKVNVGFAPLGGRARNASLGAGRAGGESRLEPGRSRQSGLGPGRARG